MCTVPAMIGLQVASGGFTAYNQIQAGKAQAGMYQYQAAQLEQQKALAQRTAEMNSKLAQDAAARKGHQLARDTSELYGKQTAVMGALGMGGGSVTAADIISDTFNKAKLDEISIRYNADVKSWEYKEQAKNEIWGLTQEQKNLEAAAKNAKKAAKAQAFGTLLNTATAVASTGLFSGLKWSTKVPTYES